MPMALEMAPALLPIRILCPLRWSLLDLEREALEPDLRCSTAKALSSSSAWGLATWPTPGHIRPLGYPRLKNKLIWSQPKDDVASLFILLERENDERNERFAHEDHYEWFKDYSHFRHLIQQHIKPNSSVLELGCGNSQLCEELYKDGITEITCIDLSVVAVEKMKKKLISKGYKEIKVLEADMLDLPFADECFDVVIEKGTMDVLFVDSGDPWNPRPATVNKVMAMLQGVHRALKPDGIFISITFGQPHFRRPLFNAPEFTWSVEWNTFGDGFHYFFYILKKGQRSSESNGISEKVDRTSISLFHDELETEDYIFRTNID